MNNNELIHWGVLGMKWGIRRYQNPDGTLTAAGKKRYNSDGSKKSIKTRYLEGKISRIKTMRKEDYDSWTKDDDLIKNGFKNKKGKVIMTPEEAKKYRKNIDNIYKKSISRNQKKLSISKLTDKFQSEASVKEKLLYNKKTRELTAKYVINNNMPLSEAKKKAHKHAIRNTAIILSVIGATQIAANVAINKMS